MASDVPRRRNYARENVTFFAEEMICYVLRRNGIDLELRRPEHIEQLRAIALYSFTPSIGDAVIFVGSQQRGRIGEEVNHIWNYVRTLRRSLRGDVLQSSIVIMGIRIINERADQYNIFVLMAIVAQLCTIFCRNHHPALIGYAVAGLEYVFNHAVRGGFPRIIIGITTLSLRMRILNPSMAL